jgi:hypothetical protein
MHYPNQESRKGIVWKEYGRNVQKIVDHILTIDDKEKRTHYANICIELMRQLNPSTKDAQDHTTKLWDHLFIMANFQLDVDAPYSMPDPSILGKKPNIVPYTNHRLAYKHYGRNIELVVKEVQAMEEGTIKDDAVIYLARLMKKSYMTWNKENVDDIVILEHLKELSKGKLSLDVDKVQHEKLLDVQIKDFKPMASKPAFESMNATGRSNQNKDFRKNNNNNRGNGNSNNSRSFKKRSN